MKKRTHTYNLFFKNSSESIKTTGEIIKIIFHNKENGFTVADFKSDNKDLITIVGFLIEPNEGDWLKIEGIWQNNKKFGKQLKIISWQIASPSTKEGIIKFLSSGLVKGVGTATAKRLVEYFGTSTLEIISENPERLTELNGIGNKKAAQISNSLKKHKDLSEIMVFLQSYGIGSGTAIKIYTKYKKDTIFMIKENPYKLADEIHGIGFHSADKIADSMGFPKDSPLRIKSALLFTLKKAMEQEGHVFLKKNEMLLRSLKLLDFTTDYDFEDILNELIYEGKIIEDNLDFYLPIMYYSEKTLARDIVELLKSPGIFHNISDSNLIKFITSNMKISLAKSQVEAVKTALKRKFSIITGGPGTGKTTLIKTITEFLTNKGKKILLAAPTGRAAKRLSEATGLEAKTIHRLLDFQPATATFSKNRENQLNCNLIVIDEASMVDLKLMAALIKAVPQNSNVVIVGDSDQLPSVGAGSVLPELIKSDKLPVVKLTEIFRQAKESIIVKCAHAVNKGENLTPGKGGKGDLFFIERDDPYEIFNVIKDMVLNRIKKNYGFDPLYDIQVLTPMHKGIIGTEQLNKMLQETFNPNGKTFSAFGKEWKIGDKILQTKNNYDLDVFNGDTGFIVNYNDKDETFVTEMDGRIIKRPLSDLREITQAYAISIHKSQGSEYPAVIIPIHTQHAIMLQRNLLYTAITRAKRLVLLIGSKKALSMAIKNNRQQLRNTKLSKRIAEYEI